MAGRGMRSLLFLAVVVAQPGLATAQSQPEILVHSFDDGLSGIRAANPDVKLGVARDASLGDEPVLIVDYPEPGSDPAGRDVSCESANRDWSSGRAISFRIKPSHALRLSVSFVDRNGVAYTARKDLEGGVWQPVRVSFDEIRPNPYFQPAGARTGSAIDVSDVRFVAFAPQDRTAGRMTISRLVVRE